MAGSGLSLVKRVSALCILCTYALSMILKQTAINSLNRINHLLCVIENVFSMRKELVF